jgi:hypothetical protein
MYFREDGSIISVNDPREQFEFVPRDYSLYKAQVVGISYTDETNNITSTDKGPQVVYEVRIIGGTRDGQLFSNAVSMQEHGGVTNTSERVWKKAKSITGGDPASPLNPLKQSSKELNGDIVYIQFLNGDPYYPVILGGAKHAANMIAGASKSEGQQYSTSFNGITSKIDKDGVFTWIKDKGSYSSSPTIDAKGNQVWDQFASLPGFEELFKLEMNNEGTLSFSIKPSPALEMNLLLDGANDLFSITTGSGSLFELNGGTGAMNLESSNGAMLQFTSAGLLKLGNSNDDVLQILKELISSLSTATYAGFGAGGSNIADLVQLLNRITLVTG